MEAIVTFEQLKQKLDEAEKAQQVSSDAFRHSLSTWYLAPELFGAPPPDPHSEEYRAFQHKIYERLTDQTYAVANENTEFDFEQEMRRPYPYATHSPSAVGHHLIGYGWLIEQMSLPVGAQILEVGSGFGSLTVHLSQIGYKVTCLDINQRFLDFIKTRTADFPESVETICGDMATVELNQEFDAIIFNASLHHTLDHKRVIDQMGQKIKPHGRFVFVAEPVVSRRSNFLPYPWGVRLDGLSVWSIVKWGWMELGFRESYFLELLNSAGWQLKRHNIGFSSNTDCWIATRKSEAPQPSRWKSALFGYDFDLESALIRQIKRVSAILK